MLQREPREELPTQPSPQSLPAHVVAELMHDSTDESVERATPPFEYQTPARGTKRGLPSPEPERPSELSPVSEHPSMVIHLKPDPPLSAHASDGSPKPECEADRSSCEPTSPRAASSCEEPALGEGDLCENCKKLKRVIGLYKQMLGKINHALHDGPKWWEREAWG